MERSLSYNTSYSGPFVAETGSIYSKEQSCRWWGRAVVKWNRALFVCRDACDAWALAKT